MGPLFSLPKRITLRHVVEIPCETALRVNYKQYDFVVEVDKSTETVLCLVGLYHKSVVVCGSVTSFLTFSCVEQP